MADNSWPFMCVSIMFTKEAIQTLRSGCLNKKCNNRKSVLSAVHEYHHACFARFFVLLTTASAHHAIHLATIRNESEASPLVLMKKFKSMKLSSSCPGNQLSVKEGRPTPEDDEVLFNDLEILQQEDRKESSKASNGSSFFGLGLFRGDKYKL